MSRTSNTALRKLVKLTLLLQFLAVSLIPQGMMTDFSGGSLTIVICTPEGIKEISVQGSENQQIENSNDCVFSLHADKSLSNHELYPDTLKLSSSPTTAVSDSHLTSLLVHLAYISRAPPTHS